MTGSQSDDYRRVILFFDIPAVKIPNRKGFNSARPKPRLRVARNYSARISSTWILASPRISRVMMTVENEKYSTRAHISEYGGDE